MMRRVFSWVLTACVLGLSSGGALAQSHGAPAHGGDHAAPAHGGHQGVAPMNWTDFSNKETPPYAALVINFALLMFAYYSFGKKPLAAALQQRKEDIGKEIEDARKLLDEAKARAKKYQKELRNVAEDAKTAKSSLHQAGEGERDRIVKDAEEKAARMRRDAAFLVEQEAKQVRQDLMRETVEEAVAQAHVLLGAAVTQADHERLAEEFLAELGTHQGSALGGRQ